MARKQVDWESVEREYRAGVRSLRDIGGQFEVTEAAIRQRAKKEGWERDLGAKIAAKAESILRKEELRKTTSHAKQLSPECEREVIEANAQVLADAVLHQRKDVSRARGVVQKLFDELEAQIDGVEGLDQLGELMASSDEDGNLDRLNALYKKIIALPSRVDSAKKLAESLRVLIELERKVLRIKDDSAIDDIAKKFGDAAAMSSMEAYARLCEGE